MPETRRRTSGRASVHGELGTPSWSARAWPTSSRQTAALKRMTRAAFLRSASDLAACIGAWSSARVRRRESSSGSPSVASRRSPSARASTSDAGTSSGSMPIKCRVTPKLDVRVRLFRVDVRPELAQPLEDDEREQERRTEQIVG